MNAPLTTTWTQGLCFVDTNVLVCAVDDSVQPKRNAAERLLAQLHREQRDVVSTQVMLELVHNLTRKLQVNKATAALMTGAGSRPPVRYPNPLHRRFDPRPALWRSDRGQPVLGFLTAPVA